MPREPLRLALQAALPSSVRVGDALRLPVGAGSIRIVQPRSPWDPQVEHGLVIGFAPRLGEALALDACHLRGRCRRSVEAVEAARAYAAGDPEAAPVLAAEAAAQIADMWAPFLKPEAWVGPSVESLLVHAANAAPADAEPLLAALRAAAFVELNQRAEARNWLENASRAVDPRVRQATAQVRLKLADA